MNTPSVLFVQDVIASGRGDDAGSQLRMAGFAVRTTTHADRALQSAVAHRPDVIVGSLHEADRDAIALCRIIRREPALDGVPIVLIGARFHYEADCTLAVAAGANVLLEDDDANALGRVVYRLVGRRRIGDSLDDGDFDRRTDDLPRRLAASEAKYRRLVESLSDVIRTLDRRGSISFVTANVQTLCGHCADHMIGRHIDFWLAQVHPDDLPRVRDAYKALLDDGEPVAIEYRWQRVDESWIWISERTAAREGDDEAFDGTLSDVSARKHLEEQMRQAQKMEAVGRLVGGIAHDFNNVLSTILADVHFLLEAIPEPDVRREDVVEIRQSAERAAALTHQLMAFSRRQRLEPRVIDMNELVVDVDRMLRRVLSEDISITLKLDATRPTVSADAGQIEQVLMNLVVNARDAMPNGGRLLIETAEVDLDGAYAQRHLPTVPGRYVMLSVSDSGCGMSEEEQRRAFEPFFTTKALGKGTGLGLATSYGIVKQSGGYIWLYSELGRGSVFKVYLPYVDAPRHPARVVPSAGELPRGNETVLLVEDDDRLRPALNRMLAGLGYRVLAAKDAANAIEIAEQHANAIDLVLSDVVMPGMSGPELVERGLPRRPRCALFMSGYTEHMALVGGVNALDRGFLQKPFSTAALAEKMRHVLNR